ncbi:unnamed protein product [Calicophoron daubneyi]|uniref:V-SNARE coiled-coil homology domain-containing protein n=1 Tax=Calicophoron daubneyi TaxID=300641 RepID=A0AAV2U0S4_CALDB
MTEKTPIVASKRLQQTQAQVNEVVDIMRVNVDKVLERDKNLSELDGRADALQAGASQFEASAGKLKRKFWWKNCKMLTLLGLLTTILIVVIIVWAVSDYKAKMALHSSSGKTNLTGTSAYSKGTPGGLRGQETVPTWSEPSSNQMRQSESSPTGPTASAPKPEVIVQSDVHPVSSSAGLLEAHSSEQESGSSKDNST